MSTFEQAFDEVFEKMRLKSLKSGKNFAVTPDTAKILIFAWNMLASSIKDGKIVLDDEAYLSDSMDIISISVKNKGQESTDKKTAEKNIAKAVDSEAPKSKKTSKK